MQHPDLAPLATLLTATRTAHTAHRARQDAFNDLSRDTATHQILQLTEDMAGDQAERRRLWEQIRLITTLMGERARGLTDSRGWPLVVGVASHSEPGLVHHVVYILDGQEPVCPCKGFAEHGHCRHQSAADRARAAGHDVA